MFQSGNGISQSGKAWRKYGSDLHKSGTRPYRRVKAGGGKCR